MDRTLREHIDSLEKKLQVLTAEVMDEEAGTLKARDELVAELRAVESALAFYRAAFAVESGIANRPKQVSPAS
jgi:hypothetical protein